MRCELSNKYKPTFFFFWPVNEWRREQMQDQGWWDWLCKERKTRGWWCTVSKWIALLSRFFLMIRLSRFSNRLLFTGPTVKITWYKKSFKKLTAHGSQRIICTLYSTAYTHTHIYIYRYIYIYSCIKRKQISMSDDSKEPFWNSSKEKNRVC